MEEKPGNRARRVAAIIAGVVCALALAGVGVALWHPWEVGGAAGPGEETTVTNGDGSQSVAENADDGSEGDSAQPSGEEAWPGQSKGYVGPNGEGVVKREDYASDEEYLAAWEEEMHSSFRLEDYEIVQDADGTPYYKGIVDITFYRSCGELRAREIVAEAGGEWLDDDFGIQSGGVDWAVVKAYFPGDVDEKAIADGLEAYSEVQSASRKGYVKGELLQGSASAGTEGGEALALIPHDQYSSQQYYLSASGFVSAWLRLSPVRTVSIAVLDTGIDLDHPDLAGNVDLSRAYDAAAQESMRPSTGDEGVSHGSATAGVASAVADNVVGISGCAYNARIIPIRVTDERVEDDGLDWDYVERALQRLADDPVKPAALNMSIRFPGFDDSQQEERIQQLIDRLRASGVVCVAAAGNSDNGSVSYPAALAGVVGVGATSTDGSTRWSEANPNGGRMGSTYNSTVDICAPGDDIVTTCNPDLPFKAGGSPCNKEYVTFSGTSMAAPQVAAAAAIVKDLHPGLTAGQVEQALTSTARRLTDASWHGQSGAGALDVGAALRSLDPSSGGTPYWTAPSSQATVSMNLLKTYAVRGGGAGPDFLGIANTNFSFPSGSVSQTDQYTGYTAADLGGLKGAALAIWATSVNESVNPYYANLYYDRITGSSATKATTWMSNPEASSWGDSNNSASHVGNVSSGASTIAGLEFSPDIIFGANKYTNWQNAAADGSNSGTNIYAYESTDSSYDPAYTSNDATNVWTQVYTMGRLASVADSLKEGTSKITRYDSNSATASAESYEKAIRGNLLYVASRIAGTETQPAVDRKTVAYLYAIDASGTGYFFVPTASGLLTGDDTGAYTTRNSAANPDACYAANDGAVSYGYMATLPFVTDTFDSGTAFSGGIVMKVEDVFKSSPACTVSPSAAGALSGVDVIIYNSTVNTSLDGTQDGRNSSGVENNYQGTALSPSKVSAWAAAHGFDAQAGSVIAGDDWGTGSQQGYGSVSAAADGMAPLLYCQDDYTADKNARAAWAFSQVYPALYNNNPDATYSYWVDKVYHVNADDVGAVVEYMTNQSDTVEYDGDVASAIESNIQAGVDWWYSDGQFDDGWNRYAYYNGSSRASYYSGNAASEEAADTIGIFAPTLL